MTLARDLLTGLVGTDVLPLIFEDLLFMGTGNVHLLHLALTCKSFCEPALDALWRHLHNLGPLLSLLPLSEFGDEGTYVSLRSMD